MNSSRREFLKTLSAGVTASALPSVLWGRNETERPNIILMMADDLGYGDVSCFGNVIIQTPNIDKIAKDGVKFTEFYAAGPTCSPSRSGLMTGRTPFRSNIYTYIANNSCVHLKEKEVTLAEICKTQDYNTGFFGKWGLVGNMEDEKQPLPSDQGFDFWLATQNNAKPTHKNPTNFYKNGKVLGKINGYSAQIVVDNAIQWLDNREDKTKPFFIVLWFHEPHRKLAQPEIFTNKYDEYSKTARKYYGNVDHLDYQIGRFMNYIKNSNFYNNSWITFTSDNGPKNMLGRDTNGLRGYKGRLYEGGYKEPTIMYWKDKLEGGKVIDEPLNFFDFVPTFYDLFNLDKLNNKPLDGISMLPVFNGKKLNRKKPPIWMSIWNISLRDGNWKIYGNFEKYSPGTSFNAYLKNRKIANYELYNVVEDPDESINLNKKYPDVFNNMKQLIDQRLKDVQKEIVPWSGKKVIPPSTATKWVNPDLTNREYINMSPKQQDLMVPIKKRKNKK